MEGGDQGEDYCVFRSEDMALLQFILSRDIAADVVRELGHRSIVSFLDLNPHLNPFERMHVDSIRRIEELERQLRVLRKEAQDWGVSIPFDDNAVDVEKLSIDTIESNLEVTKEVVEIAQSHGRTVQRLREVAEHLALIRAAQGMFKGISLPTAPAGEVDVEGQPLLDTHLESNISGLIAREQRRFFERLVFRTCHGNVLMNFFDLDVSPTDINSPATAADNEKLVGFVLLIPSKVAQERVAKLCFSQNVRRYSVPADESSQRDTSHTLARQHADAMLVSNEQKKRAVTLLERICPFMETYHRKLVQETAVSHTLGLFSSSIRREGRESFPPSHSSHASSALSGRGLLVGEGWCPAKKVGLVREAIAVVESSHGAEIPSIVKEIPPHSTPPTYIPTSPFTRSFQDLVDSYGTPRYKELNPGVFAVITFPFLFGIMFGDIGHGVLLTAFSAYLVLNAENLKKKERELGEIFTSVLGGRYVLLLMGIFSIYCGLLYNEFFGFSLNLFGSCWRVDKETHHTHHDCTYPVGVDPEWNVSPSRLGYANSLKMKLSLVIGVSQMLFGLAGKYANSIHFRKHKDLFFEAIPETVFLSSIFGYLVVLIFIKWATPWVELGLPAPSLLNTLLSMFLKFYLPIPEKDLLYEGQTEVQLFLIGLALASVPILLLVKPILIIREKTREGYQTILPENEGGVVAGGHEGGGGDGHGHGEDPTEIMIHQVIHTLEYVLGTVSNTASYLRLWALSLAHSQLSDVFWERIVITILKMDGMVLRTTMLVGGIVVWASLTFAVLLVMEMMSAALHDIRLHWVEYQGKFFSADGVKFAPLSFAELEADASAKRHSE